MDFSPLAGRARLLFYLQAFSRLLLFWTPVLLTAGVFGIGWVGALYSLGAASSLWFLLFLAAVWLPWLRHERWGFAMRDGDLLIRRGVIVRSVTAIPLTRIQHVDTQQGPLEQWLGLARVRIHTASGVGGDGTIPGLETADADALRDALVTRGGDSGV